MPPISVAFLAIAALLALANWLNLLAALRLRGKRRVSLVPFVGAVFCAIGISLAPSLPLWAWGLLFLATRWASQ